MIEMGVIGFNFRSINAHSEDKKVEGSIDVNSSPSVENIIKKELNVPGFKDVISIEFKFTTRYEPKVGEINITGEVLYQTEDYKKILGMWKEKRLETKIATEVLNTIFRKCLTKAVSIAEELRLPPPLTFPVVRAENKRTSAG